MNRPNMKRLAVTLAVVMISLLAPTTVARAAGNGLTPYITDLMLIGKNNKSEAEALKAQYVKDGWTAIEQDLNAGCGSKSDYIYLLYKVGNLASANQSFITDIYITTDGTSDINATRTINRREYKLVPYDGDEHFMEKKGDLNSNAGGDDIHLYYTTDNYDDYMAISSIAFNETQSDAVGKNGDNSKGYDLNTRAGGEDIYMHCTRNGAPQWIIEKNNDGSGRCIIKGFNVPTGGIGKGDIKAFPSRVCGAHVVGVASSLNYKDFPNIGTIYLYEKPLSSVMIPMNECENLQHVHTVDILGNVIKSDELPTSITSIPKRGFENCSALKSLTIPASVTSIADDAFSECGLTAFTVDKDNPTYQSVNGVLMDKAGKILIAYPCGSTTKEFVIPNGVTSILKGAFYGCTGLKSLTIQGSVTSIEPNLFVDHTFLESVIIRNGVTSIGEYAFLGCTGLTNVTIGSSVTSIGECAFYQCTSLKNATIKSGDIGIQAFRDCSALESVTIENGVTSIGQEAFYKCPLTSITIPGSVTSIGESAFDGCTSLESVTIEDGVESIGQGAFYDCDNLASVSIMGNPKIGQDAIPDGATVTLSLTSNAANGAKWMTFYNDRYNFQADANTTVYKATVVGQSLVLTEVADRIVNGVEWYFDEATDPATAVILKSTGNPVMTRVTGRSSDGQANALLGTMEATATPANCFTLASGSKGVGFYHYTGSEVAAGKAYLIHNGASSAREFIGFDEEGETTGIVAIDHSPLTIDHSPFTIDHSAGAWYSIDGRKLQGGPSKKGIYVRNGIKVVIK